jgi:hypothetical protein
MAKKKVEPEIPVMGNRRLRKLNDEVWKTLEFTDRHYEISSYGRIKSFYYDKKGKIIKGLQIEGFYAVDLLVKGERKRYLVHKLTAEYFVPKDGDDQTVVIHLDWNKANNYYQNLKWSTQKDSFSRMHKRNYEVRKKKGLSMITYSKLKVKDVEKIKSMLQRGIKQNVIAKLFCVSEMQITRIKRGENWGTVQAQ